MQHHVSSCLYKHHLFCEWVKKLRLKKNNIVKQLLLTFDFRAPQFIMHPGPIQIGHNYGLGKVLLDIYISIRVLAFCDFTIRDPRHFVICFHALIS